MDDNLEELRNAICTKYGAVYFASPDNLRVGIASNVEEGLLPINGLRHPPEGNTTGWYTWAGEEFSYEPDFFQPMCVHHLQDFAPLILKYLALPPGYRFLITPDYEDGWYDEKVLIV